MIRIRMWNRFVWLVLLLLVMSACDALSNLLEVEPQDEVAARSLEAPEHASLLVKSAVADFDCAFSNYVMAGGLVANEVVWGDLNTYDYDRRTFTAVGGNYATSKCATGIATGGLGVYTPLSTARWSADHVHRLLEGWTDTQVANRSALMATASAYSGYSHLLLGEAMCAASIDVGPRLSRMEIWERAEAIFTRAIAEAQATGNAEILNMAYLGRARAWLNMNRGREAVADAQRIPDGFVRNATYAGTTWRSSNQAWQWINVPAAQVRAAISEAYWNLTWDGVPDPRVSLIHHSGQFAHDGVTPLVEQMKYPAATSPIPIARWAEAQLIIAEVEGGQAAVDIINELHRRAGLPQTFASSEPAEIQDHVLEERRRELFLESHRFGDMLRLNIPFSPPTGTPYKLNSGTYGSMTCFPYPDVERLNNPNAG